MKFARLWFVAATAAAVGSLALVWHLRQPEQLVGPLQQELATLPDNEVETPLRRFAELGGPGLKALAESLASERAAVRQGARRVLLEEVDRWALLSDDAVAPRLEALARGLAEAAPRMDTENRRLAADLALRLVLRPRDGDSRPGTWLADCDVVLATATERPPPVNSAAALLAEKNASAPDASQPVPAAPGLSDVSLTLADKVRLPGGALPLDESPMPDVGGFVEPQSVRKTAPTESREPRRLQVPANTRSLGGDNGGGDDDDDDDGGPQPGAANRPARLPSASGNSRQTALGLQARKQSLGGPTANDTAAWRQLQPRDVMSRLHVSDPQVVLAAREELERRGISGPLVDLARRATDPDPNVRRELAKLLPSLPGIDAKPWLLELSFDENAQVRTTAVTLMATSGDLEMVRRLEQISRDDPDDYTRAQAAKALAPRER